VLIGRQLRRGIKNGDNNVKEKKQKAKRKEQKRRKEKKQFSSKIPAIYIVEILKFLKD